MITGEELRQIRRSLPERPSQKAFAELLGVTRSAVADWEGGRQAVPVMAGIIARAISEDMELTARIREWRGINTTADDALHHTDEPARAQ